MFNWLVIYFFCNFEWYSLKNIISPSEFIIYCNDVFRIVKWGSYVYDEIHTESTCYSNFVIATIFDFSR